MSAPTYSGRSIPNRPSTLPRAPQKRRRGPGAWLGIAAIAGLVGLAGWTVLRDDGEQTATEPGDEQAATALSETTIASPAEVETTTPTTAAPTTLAPTTTAAPETTAAPTTAAPTTAAPTTAAPTTAAPDQPELDDDTASALVAGPEVGADFSRTAVLSGGVLFLRGEVPSEEVSLGIQAKAEAVLGAENVVNEYEIVDGAPLPDAGLLYVEDVVLFPYAGAELNPAFVPLLDLGIVLLQQNPQATITVVAHTDASGTAAYNLELSQARAQQVADYWIAAGVDPAQIEVIGKGESEPIADETTPQGAQLNRRAEFIITGLLS